MKRVATLLVITFATCLSLAAQQATVTRNVNLRPTPSAAGMSKLLLQPPEPLTLLAPDPTAGYYHVRTQQHEDGWVWGRNIAIAAPDTSKTAAPDSAGLPLPAPETFAVEHASCPAVGSHTVNGAMTSYPANSDAGLRNMAKRHIPAGVIPVTLDLATLHALQEDINSRFADAHHTKTAFQPSRDALLNRPMSSGTVSEGDLVQIAAYLTAVRQEGAESVSCAGGDGTDLHLNIGVKHSTEWQGIVVEMIPQLARPVGWDVVALTAIEAQQLQVLVVGGLTYDNEHFINDDAAHPNGTQPKRMSLWEIHPITAFYVCEIASCSPTHHGEWTTLTAWAQAHSP